MLVCRRGGPAAGTQRSVVRRESDVDSRGCSALNILVESGRVLSEDILALRSIRWRRWSPGHRAQNCMLDFECSSHRVMPCYYAHHIVKGQGVTHRPTATPWKRTYRRYGTSSPCSTALVIHTNRGLLKIRAACLDKSPDTQTRIPIPPPPPTHTHTHARSYTHALKCSMLPGISCTRNDIVKHVPRVLVPFPITSLPPAQEPQPTPHPVATFDSIAAANVPDVIRLQHQRQQLPLPAVQASAVVWARTHRW